MKKYHVATGDGKAYYGVGYESYREAEGVLKISQMHDPQAHIVEEEYHFTNADRIRAMSDDELVEILLTIRCQECPADKVCDLPTGNFGKCRGTCVPQILKWLKQPADEQHKHFPNGDGT